MSTLHKSLILTQDGGVVGGWWGVVAAIFNMTCVIIQAVTRVNLPAVLSQRKGEECDTFNGKRGDMS